ncbi:MAG TPA: PEGA domain-containing protein, partial [Kofleriaceae bacterium]
DANIVGGGPCLIRVATTPAGSTVRLDDQPVGPSPIALATSCGKHKLDVAHARYQAATRVVTVAADAPQQVEISLPRPTHAVTVTSVPSGADVAIEGHRAGTTPTTISVMGFATISLTISKPGYAPVTQKLYSKTPEDRVSVKLTR